MENFIKGYSSGQQIQMNKLNLKQKSKEIEDNILLGDLTKQYIQDQNPQTLQKIAALKPETAKGLLGVQKYMIEDKARNMKSLANTFESASESQKTALYPKLIKEAQKSGFDTSNIPLEYNKDTARDISSIFKIESQKADQILGIEPYEAVSPIGKIEQDYRRGALSEDAYRAGMQKETKGEQDKAPSGYRWTQQGKLEPIPGGPATKLSETASKTMAITTQGSKSINELESIITKLGDKIDAKTAIYPNIMLSTDQQKFRTLKADLSDMIGRLRSGGAINMDEEKRFKGLLPSFGDTKDTIEFKLNRFRENLNQVTSSLEKGTTPEAEKKSELPQSKMSENKQITQQQAIEELKRRGVI